MTLAWLLRPSLVYGGRRVGALRGASGRGGGWAAILICQREYHGIVVANRANLGRWNVQKGVREGGREYIMEGVQEGGKNPRPSVRGNRVS